MLKSFGSLLSVSSDSTTGSLLPGECLGSQLNEEVRPWIELIDDLRDVGIHKDISIPTIAVVGDQSSGKSSVLESLSGVQFPRGTKLVTRCATEVRMKRTTDGQWKARVSVSWSDPQPKEAGDVKSPSEIGTKISQLTEALLLARGKNATFEPDHHIIVEVGSPDLHNLTIVDLPGLIRNTIEGQSEAAIDDVRSMCRKYLKEDRTIILAVANCDADFSTVGAFTCAAESDPEGYRTLGVLTKPDLAGEHEDATIDILKNKTKPLMLGYMMVKNRSRVEREKGVTLEEAIRQEKKYFQEHPEFGSMNSELFGVDNLRRKLTQILVNRIKETLPDMYHDVSNQIAFTSDELERLGESAPESQEGMKMALVDIVQASTEDIRSAVGGNYESEALYKNPDLRIYAKFKDFGVKFSEKIERLEPKWDIEDLKHQAAKMKSRELPGFLTPTVFNILVRDFVEKWKAPLEELLTATQDMLISACSTIIEHHVQRYKRITQELQSLVRVIVKTRVKSAKEGPLEDLFNNEREPSTMNSELLDAYNDSCMRSFRSFVNDCFQKVPATYTEDGEVPATYTEDGEVLYSRRTIQGYIEKEYNTQFLVGSESSQTREAKSLKALLQAYWKLSTKRFIDNAIRSVDRLLMQKLDKDISRQFTTSIDKSTDLEEFFCEDTKTKEKRRNLKTKKERLEQAQHKISHRLV